MLASLFALYERSEVVSISSASSISEGTALSGFRIEGETLEDSIALSRINVVFAHIQKSSLSWGNIADRSAFFTRSEVVSVSLTSSVGEDLAVLFLIIPEPSHKVSLAVSCVQRVRTSVSLGELKRSLVDKRNVRVDWKRNSLRGRSLCEGSRGLLESGGLSLSG